MRPAPVSVDSRHAAQGDVKPLTLAPCRPANYGGASACKRMDTKISQVWKQLLTLKRPPLRQALTSRCLLLACLSNCLQLLPPRTGVQSLVVRWLWPKTAMNAAWPLQCRSRRQWHPQWRQLHLQNQSGAGVECRMREAHCNGTEQAPTRQDAPRGKPAPAAPWGSVPVHSHSGMHCWRRARRPPPALLQGSVRSRSPGAAAAAAPAEAAAAEPPAALSCLAGSTWAKKERRVLHQAPCMVDRIPCMVDRAPCKPTPAAL